MVWGENIPCEPNFRALSSPSSLTQQFAVFSSDNYIWDVSNMVLFHRSLSRNRIEYIPARAFAQMHSLRRLWVLSLKKRKENMSPFRVSNIMLLFQRPQPQPHFLHWSQSLWRSGESELAVSWSLAIATRRDVYKGRAHVCVDSTQVVALLCSLMYTNQIRELPRGVFHGLHKLQVM